MTIQTLGWNEGDAYEFLESLRWRDSKSCPHCGSEEQHMFLRPEDGRTRRTRTGATSERRVWKCGGCRRQFSVLTGTFFEGTKVPLCAWITLVDILCSGERWTYRGLEDQLGVSLKTAFRMVKTIGEAKGQEPLLSMLEGHS